MEGANPYYRRSAISLRDEFFGRRDELSEIYQLLRHQQSIFLYGERRTGKSSILNALTFLRDEYNIPSQIHFAQVNCLYAEGSPERRFIKHMLEQIDPDLDLDSIPPERDSLMRVAEKAKRDGQRLVILMDEFDVLVENPHIGNDLFSFFRAWSESFGIPFVITTREGAIDPLVKTKSAGSPFWNIFKTVYVGPFPHHEALELIETPAKRLNVPFKEEEVKWIYDHGGHHPFFLQIAASCAFMLRQSDPARKHIAFVSEADQHFDYLLDFMSDKERSGLLSFINHKRVDSRTKSTLLHKGMLIEEGDQLRVFSEALTEKLRAREKDSEGGSTNIVANISQFIRGV